MAPVKTTLDEITEGDHLFWPAIYAENIDDEDVVTGNPDVALARLRVQFRKKDGTLGCTLDTEASADAIQLTLSDASTWTVDELEIAATDHGLTAGAWHWDAEVTQADDVIITVAAGVLTVRPQITKPA